MDTVLSYTQWEPNDSGQRRAWVQCAAVIYNAVGGHWDDSRFQVEDDETDGTWDADWLRSLLDYSPITGIRHPQMLPINAVVCVYH